jgi:small subunit ribosomal protein S8
MMTDPIADMLTRLRNAAAVKKQEVVLPLSRVKFEIAKVLEKEGYLAAVQRTEENHGELKVKIRYTEEGAALHEVKRISKPGRRVYAAKTELPRVLNDFGVAIISTSAGIMTNKEARKRGLGGEVICEIF